MADVPMKQQIIDKLTHAFAPDTLEVIDESHLHAGHAGAREGGESHFRVKITSQSFNGHKLVQRHRMINEVLAEELAGPIHALAIKADVPEG